MIQGQARDDASSSQSANLLHDLIIRKRCMDPYRYMDQNKKGGKMRYEDKHSARWAGFRRGFCGDIVTFFIQLFIKDIKFYKNPYCLTFIAILTIIIDDNHISVTI